QPHPGDRVGQVGVGEYALLARTAVVADERDRVDVPALHPLHHGEVLVPAGEHLGALVQPLQQQVAHGGVGLVDQDLGCAAGVEPGDGRIDVGGEHRPAALPLLGAGLDVGGPGDAGGAFHVGGDQNPHGGDTIPCAAGVARAARAPARV